MDIIEISECIEGKDILVTAAGNALRALNKEAGSATSEN